MVITRKPYKRIILVTGTPGVGKTAVSRLLTHKLTAKHIDLGELVKRENLISGVDEARGTLIVDTDKISKRLKEIIRYSKRDLLIDGHYAVDVIPVEKIHLVLVLRRDPEELKDLMENKGFNKKKVRENLAAEILDVCLFDAVKACGLDKVCEIDTTGKEIEEVAKEAVSVLRGEKKCQVGVVDWLEKLERNGRLHNFFI
jgi:adenylate kinase